MKTYIILLLLFSTFTMAAQTLIEDAEKSLLLKNYPETARICQSLLKTSPEREDVKLMLGLAFQGMQDYQKALEIYNNINKSDDNTVEFLRAECIEKLGDIGSAIKIYSDILSRDTTELQATMNIARLRLKTKNYTEARKYYRKLVAANPDSYIFQKNLGICHYQLLEEFYALDNFRRAWELNKLDLELPINIANVYARIQEPFAALDILAEGLKYDSTNTAILKTAAFISYKLEDLDTATYLFNRAFELGDSTTFTRKYLGISYFKTYQFAEAIPHLRAFYQSDSLNTESTYYLGMALTAMHEKLNGIEFLLTTIDLMNPDSSFIGSIYSTIGRTWTDINEIEKGLKYYAKAISYDPSEPIYIYEKAKLHDQLGIMHGDRKQLETATREYERFLELQIDIIKRAYESRGLDKDQVSSPGIKYSRERIKKIQNELFFLGEEKK